MLTPQQNRLLPFLAVIALLVTVLVFSKSCGNDGTDTVQLARVPTASSPDADSPADTIKTLTANVAAMTAELQSLRQANTTLRNDNEALIEHRSDLDARVATRIEAVMSALEQRREQTRANELAQLDQRLDALSDALAAAASSDGPLPVGLGLEGFEVASELTWIEPLDAPAGEFGGALWQRVGQRDIRQTRRNAADPMSDGPPEIANDQSPKPVYTVPRNATLMGATAMTALLGRVPRQGEVRDPMPFKVITGPDNLAANGLTIPGVEGMIWSGTAIGDWTLSCVTGRLESVTFVFDDGHIRTLSTDDREQRTGDANRPLGWISDAQGIPCVSGERKSNAAAFLTQRIGIKAIEAAAEAAAASQTTTVIRDSGAISSNVGGDTGAFVLGKTAASGTSEIAKWLLERQAQSFDAVFVPAGAEVALHVDRELSIDLDPNGRRLSHEDFTDNPDAYRLD